MQEQNPLGRNCCVNYMRDPRITVQVCLHVCSNADRRPVPPLRAMMSWFFQREIAAKLYQNEVERINEAHDTAIEQASKTIPHQIKRLGHCVL